MVYNDIYSVDIFPISMSIHPKLSPSINRCPESVPMTAQLSTQRTESRRRHRPHRAVGSPEP